MFPIPGPCEYCAGIGAPCVVNIPRKQRPFYHVTEEEYRLSMLILQHHYPDRELNLDALRTIVDDLKRAGGEVSGTTLAGVCETSEIELSSNSDVESERLAVLHKEIACVQRDYWGRYRQSSDFQPFT